MSLFLAQSPKHEVPRTQNPERSLKSHHERPVQQQKTIARDGRRHFFEAAKKRLHCHKDTLRPFSASLSRSSLHRAPRGCFSGMPVGRRGRGTWGDGTVRRMEVITPFLLSGYILQVRFSEKSEPSLPLRFSGHEYRPDAFSRKARTDPGEK